MTQELEIAALQPGMAHLIEANAGTGKTYAIANLFLRFVLDGHPVERILVVTFTRAATSELRQRIRARLALALQHLQQESPRPTGDAWFDGLSERFATPAARRAACLRLELALLSINEAPIHTIHGFCQQALTELAFHSGEPFELEPADDSRLYQQALHDWWRTRTYELDASSLASLLQATGGLDSFAARLEPLLKPHAPELVPEPLDAAATETLEREADELQRQLARAWRQHGESAVELLLTSNKLSRTATNGQKPEQLAPVLAKISEQLRTQPDSPLPSSQLRHIATGSIQLKPSQRDCDDFACEPFTLAARLLALRETLERQQRLSLLEEARAYIERHLERAKQRKGVLSFDDMIVRLRHALVTTPSLARELAERLPVIMVDEFQDTDPLQYDIFRRLHQAGKDDHTLIMIGDPKQAIYGFRGGDIFAYLRAAEEADRRWSLSTNWRATPAMIAAVNHLFSGPRPFVFRQIGYRPSRAPGQAGPPPLSRASPAPFVVHRLPMATDNGKVKPLNRDQAHALVHRAVARRISWLLHRSGLQFDGRPLAEGDICVLVRTGEEAGQLRQVLRQHGIRAVSTGNARLWETPEATGLRWLLEATLLPEDRRLARQALAAPFLALPPEQLHALIESPPRWGRWVALLHEANEQWRKRGFMAAFDTLLQGLDGALRDPADAGGGWLQQVEDPERCLTNLLHLAELLQHASREQGDAERLLAWMREQAAHPTEEDQLLRLESDERLVKIATIHASKGLQYPVVMVPYLWHCRRPSGNAPLTWHEQADDTLRHCYRPWPDDDPQPLHLADRERLAEDLRLTYVALTRAQVHCELWVGEVGRSRGHTAIDWLLSEQTQSLEQGPFRNENPEPGLARWATSPHIQILEMPASAPPSDEAGESHAPKESTPALTLAKLNRRIRNDWRIASFTALTREVHQATRVPPGEGTDFALSYPAGARVGSFLHALLEQVDATQPLSPQVAVLAPGLALKHGLPPDQEVEGLAGWLEWILETPLDESGLQLRQLPPEKARHELAFDFSTGRVRPAELDALLRRHLPPEVTPDSVPPLRFSTFQGMVTGIIDLVFEHRGRYYLADYKSNLLGRSLDHYAPHCLAREIAARRYDLQYLLYSLALHRHLRSCLPDYDYARHFGGVYYLFLRGMRPWLGATRGVWFHRPDEALVETLDRTLFASEAAA